MQLEGKVALITGGGTGIGAAIAERFVAEGAKVVITGRRQEVLERAASSLPEGTCATCAGSVCSDDDSLRMVESALSLTGRLDILVNNAGTGAAGMVTEMESSVWRQELEHNLTGPFLMMKAALPGMVKAGGGSIINIASLAGVRAVPGSPAYCATKAGLIHLTKQVALDYGKYNIRCNVVCPGPVRTDLLDTVLDPLAKAMGTDLEGVYETLPGKAVPLQRAAAPAEMTGICTYLASDDSSFMTGATLMMDGGIHIVDAFANASKDMGVNWG